MESGQKENLTKAERDAEELQREENLRLQVEGVLRRRLDPKIAQGVINRLAAYDRQGRQARRLKATDRRQLVLDLKKSGLSLRKIAARLSGYGYSVSYETVRTDLRASLALIVEHEQFSAVELRMLEVERMDEKLEALELLFDKESDTDRKLRIYDRIESLQAQRRKLLDIDLVRKPNRPTREDEDEDEHIADLNDEQRLDEITRLADTARKRKAGQATDGEA
jgi:hypothetical protein